jgi:hypothetical protein
MFSDTLDFLDHSFHSMFSVSRNRIKLMCSMCVCQMSGALENVSLFLMNNLALMNFITPADAFLMFLGYQPDASNRLANNTYRGPFGGE